MVLKHIKLPQNDGKMPHNTDGEVKSNRDRRQIDLLFGSGARVDVLWCLMLNPTIGLEQSEIMHLTERSLKDVQRALSILQELDLVVKVTGLSGEQGVMPSAYLHKFNSPEWVEEHNKGQWRTRYHLVENNPWIPPLRMLFECAIGGLDLIKRSLRGIPNIFIAFVFGSFATSEQNSESDIDLMVIGNHDSRCLGDKIISLEKRIGREIQLITYTPGEWRKAFQDRSHFVVSLMEAPKIYLMADAVELQKITLGSEE
jgi:predicted nucleotidyltransferase